MVTQFVPFAEQFIYSEFLQGLSVFGDQLVTAPYISFNEKYLKNSIDGGITMVILCNYETSRVYT